MGAGCTPFHHRLAAGISQNRKLSKEHLVNSKAPIPPGVQVEKNLLTHREFRCPEYDTDPISGFPSHLLDDDLSAGELSLQHILEFQRSVGVDVVAALV